MSRPILRRLIGVAAALSSLMLPGVSRAWGDAGHEIVATIAYARLTAHTRARVGAMLAADEDKLTAADFVSRATWADRYRDADRETTRERYEATRQWHFVDIEIDGGSLDAACHRHPPLPTATPASAGPADACVVDKVDQFAAELKDRATPARERLLALKFLMHLVGDLHQPLHAADRHDNGGNALPVLYGALAAPVNLHSYWDLRLVQLLGADPKAVGAELNRSITRAQVRAWSRGTASDWADEASSRARAVAYDFSGQTPFTDARAVPGLRVDETYDARALPVVRQQLSRAGVRLAALLNRSLK